MTWKTPFHQEAQERASPPRYSRPLTVFAAGTIWFSLIAVICVGLWLL